MMQAMPARDDYAISSQKFEDSMRYRIGSLHSPEPVAKTIHQALTAKQPKARYTIVPNFLRYWLLHNLIPEWMRDRLFTETLGIQKRQTRQK